MHLQTLIFRTLLVCIIGFGFQWAGIETSNDASLFKFFVVWILIFATIDIYATYYKNWCFKHRRR